MPASSERHAAGLDADLEARSPAHRRHSGSAAAQSFSQPSGRAWATLRETACPVRVSPLRGELSSRNQ